MAVQIIEKSGKPECAVIRYAENQALLEMVEDVRDLQDVQSAIAEMAAEGDEAIPAKVAERLVAGDEHPLRVWREYRGYTQESLGAEAGIGKSYVPQIEAGNKTGSTRILNALAKALGADIEDLLSNELYPGYTKLSPVKSKPLISA